MPSALSQASTWPNAYLPDHERDLIMISGPTKSGRTHILECLSRHRRLQPQVKMREGLVRSILKVDISAGDHRRYFAADIWQALQWHDHDQPPPVVNWSGLP